MILYNSIYLYIAVKKSHLLLSAWVPHFLVNAKPFLFVCLFVYFSLLIDTVMCQ